MRVEFMHKAPGSQGDSIHARLNPCLIHILYICSLSSTSNHLVHMRRRVQTLVAALFVTILVCVAAMGQQPRTYPPYTLVTRSTEYDPKGEVLRVSTQTSYHSSNGDWRTVGKSGDIEYASLYRRGKGVYQSNSRTHRLIKQMNHAPGCPLRTAEELRADRKFTRTEEILGFTAYVWSESPNADLSMEHYYVAELGGGTPVKSATTYKNGPKVVSDVISIKLGEPDASDIAGPDYLVIEQEPRFVNNIAEQLLDKPEPDYPAEALARGLSGYVNVSVVVDENGSVISAGARAGGAAQLLRQAAVDAAFKASFKPLIIDGQAFVTTGMINYQFVLPK